MEEKIVNEGGKVTRRKAEVWTARKWLSKGGLIPNYLKQTGEPQDLREVRETRPQNDWATWMRILKSKYCLVMSQIKLKLEGLKGETEVSLLQAQQQFYIQESRTDKP